MTRLLEGENLGRFYQLEPERCITELTECLSDGTLKATDFSIRETAEAIMGRDWVQQLAPKSGRFVPILEASQVQYSDFSNITGQIFFTMAKEAYQSEEFVFSKVVPSVASKIQDMEKIPGISEIGDEAEIVDEGMAYPLVGVTEDYIEAAAKQKRGMIVPVTKEAIFGDLTGKLLKRCSDVGKWLGVNKEKRIIDAVIDENTGAKSAALGGHRYHWRGTSIATYGDNSGDHTWDNLAASNGLVDYSDIEAAWLLLSQMIDPFTGEPIDIMPTHLIVTPNKVWTASRILNATEVRSGDITTGDGVQTIAGNPVKMVIGQLQVLSSRLLAARAATDTDWWMGNPAEAFVYLYNWDITTEEAPPNSTDAFHRDIVQQFKVSEKGIVATKEPRLMVESNA